MKFRFSLLTLLIIMLLVGALTPFAWVKWKAWRNWREQQQMEQMLQQERAESLRMMQAIIDAMEKQDSGHLQSPEMRERIKAVLESEQQSESAAVSE